MELSPLLKQKRALLRDQRTRLSQLALSHRVQDQVRLRPGYVDFRYSITKHMDMRPRVIALEDNDAESAES